MLNKGYLTAPETKAKFGRTTFGVMMFVTSPGYVFVHSSPGPPLQLKVVPWGSLAREPPSGDRLLHPSLLRVGKQWQHHSRQPQSIGPIGSPRHVQDTEHDNILIVDVGIDVLAQWTWSISAPTSLMLGELPPRFGSAFPSHSYL